MQYKVIAIDGPAGAGKSTIAKLLASRLGYTYIDSGAMYRAVTYKVIQNNIDITDKQEVIKTALASNIDFKEGSVYLDEIGIDNEIRKEAINKNVSAVSAIPEIRKILIETQRRIANNKDIVMDGRDIGTVVFPHAFIKFFVTASTEERAKRRYEEIIDGGHAAELAEIMSQIEARDLADMSRATCPLKAADDAIQIDTTGKTIGEVLDEVVLHINKHNN